MNPFKLTGTAPNGKEAHVWGCGICLHVCVNEDHANRCCTCSYCGKPIDGDDIGKRQTYHKACMDAASDKIRQDRIDKAEKLETWDGPVFWGDQFQRDLQDAIECMDDIDPRPEWICVAKRCPPKELDAEDILESHCDDMGEDAYDYLNGVKEFEAACEAFNEANKNAKWYEEDRTRMVRVPQRSED